MSYVPGAEDIERKYEYWIEFGRQVERKHILEILEGLLDQSNWTNTEEDYAPEEIQRLILLINGDNE